jgi:hypothetical protein
MSFVAKQPEPYLPPKELPDALCALGITGFNLRACRSLVRAMKDGGAPVVRQKFVRASDAAAFLAANSNWSPYSCKNRKNG